MEQEELEIGQGNFLSLTFLWLPLLCYGDLKYDLSVYTVFFRTRSGLENFLAAALCSIPRAVQMLNFEVLLSALSVGFCCQVFLFLFFIFLILVFAVFGHPYLHHPLAEPSIPLTSSVSAYSIYFKFLVVFLQCERSFSLLEEDVCQVFQRF